MKYLRAGMAEFKMITSSFTRKKRIIQMYIYGHLNKTRACFLDCTTQTD